MSHQQRQLATPPPPSPTYVEHTAILTEMFANLRRVAAPVANMWLDVADDATVMGTVVIPGNHCCRTLAYLSDDTTEIVFEFPAIAWFIKTVYDQMKELSGYSSPANMATETLGPGLAAHCFPPPSIEDSEKTANKENEV